MAPTMQVEVPTSEYVELKAMRAMRRGGTRRFTPAVSKARAREQARRATLSRYRAHEVLSARHADEYAAILRSERAFIDFERGSLPGDV